MAAASVLLRPIAAFAVGLATCAGLDRGSDLLFAARFRPGPPVVWVADRDAGRLVALDAGLYRCAAAALVAPVAVAACADGGAWAVDAIDGRDVGAYRLVRVTPDGEVRARIELGGCAGPPGLAVIDGGGAVFCASSEEGAASATNAGARLGVVDESGALTWSRSEPRARRVAARGTRVLVGRADGRARLFDLAFGGALVGERHLDGEVLDVAPGPGQGWWALVGGDPRVVCLLRGDSLAQLWRGECETPAVGLAPAAVSSREPYGAAWLVAEGRSAVRRVVPFAPARPELAGLPLGSFGAATALPLEAGGGLWLPAPGALLQLDERGRLSSHQGGFDRLVAASAVPGRGPP